MVGSIFAERRKPRGEIVGQKRRTAEIGSRGVGVLLLRERAQAGPFRCTTVPSPSCPDSFAPQATNVPSAHSAKL